MCRWVAYAGPDIYLEDLLFSQENSLISQSLRARQSVQTTNGDGFGVAWYGRRTKPGLFRDILPAWNDENLRSLAAQVQSRLFFAHVRASTGTSVARSNCHPFQFKNWAFMHNGKIGNWMQCRREVEALISPDLYQHRQGTTDSEAMFMVALSQGLREDPQRAMERTVKRILQVMQSHQASEPLRMSAAVTDGKMIWAFRYSSDRASPSLYFGSPRTRAADNLGADASAPIAQALPTQINTIASEPSDEGEHWQAVPEAHGLQWREGQVSTFAFEPA